jgi:hypothetical protein
MSDLRLSDSRFSHTLDISVDRIDIADWLFNLSNDEYKRCCPPDHIAVGATSSDDGRRMSINVERIGETLTIQQYVAEIDEKHHCRMVSMSDAFSTNRRLIIHLAFNAGFPAAITASAIANGAIGEGQGRQRLSALPHGCCIAPAAETQSAFHRLPSRMVAGLFGANP